MASRNFNRYQALEKEIKTLYAEVAIGASGAPTLTSGLGITSVARTAAGDYTVTLNDRYQRLVHASATLLDSTEEDITVQVATATNSVNSATPTVGFICKAGATATDPSDGATILFKFELKNTKAGE